MQQQKKMREVTPRQLAQHASSESCWIVIEGFVYDVTEFHHPGGNDRLFDLGGMDATQAFLAIGHSPVAQKELTKLLVGRLVDDSSLKPTPAPLVPSVSTEKMDRRRALKEGSVHRLPREGEQLWCTRRRGFLPARDPLITLDEPYGVLLELMAQMPTALADGSFRATVDAASARFEPIAAAIADEPSIDVLERVHGLYGYLGKGYVHGTTALDEDGALSVPAYMSAGWLAVSHRLGRPPTIDYADCVLYNWERLDPRAGMTPENIRMLNRFTGLVDEEWFLKTHVVIESEASGCGSATPRPRERCRALRLRRPRATTWVPLATTRAQPPPQTPRPSPPRGPAPSSRPVAPTRRLPVVSLASPCRPAQRRGRALAASTVFPPPPSGTRGARGRSSPR